MPPPPSPPLQVKDQQEAEKKKVTSQEIQEALQRQTREVRQKKQLVLGDLAKVEPAVKDAQTCTYSDSLVSVLFCRNPNFFPFLAENRGVRCFSFRPHNSSLEGARKLKFAPFCSS